MNNVFGIIFANYTAQGFGELLRRRTVASLPYGGRYRLVDFPLSNMINSGITTVGLIMPSYYRSLIDHVGSGKEWNLDRKIGGLFILPGTVYGGHSTKESIRLSDLLENHRYIERRSEADYAMITTASKVCNMDYRPLIEQHTESGKAVTFVYYKNKQGDPVPLETLIVNKEILMDLVGDFSNYSHLDLSKLLHQEIAPKDVGRYEFEGYVKSIDSVEEYIEASRDLLDPKIMTEIFRTERTIYTKTQDEAPTIYKENAQVVNSIVSAGCRIDGRVENCILFRNVNVEKGAELKDCIVMQHTTIKEGAVLSNVILDKYVTISKDVKLTGGNKPVIVRKNVEI